MYVMESPNEGLRMERRDRDEALTHLRLAGIVPGSRVLDCGCASGWLTRIIGEQCAPGEVTGLDISDSRISLAYRLAHEHLASNVRFVEGDMQQLPFADGTFDITFSRYTFEYLQDPLKALREMRRVTQPGGQVVVADLDGNGVFHYPMTPRVEQGLARLTGALSRYGFDPYIGRKLYSMFRQVPFERVEVQALPHHLIAGAANAEQLENWEAKLRTVRPFAIKAFGSETAYDEFAEECLELLRSPEVLSYSVTFIVTGVV